MGMQQKVLSPGVQNAEHANLGAQVFGIGCYLEQGLSAGGEQQIVEQTWVVQGQHIQLVGHAEHDMEVVGRQKFSFSCLQPALACLRLALGATSISAGVIRDSLMANSTLCSAWQFLRYVRILGSRPRVRRSFRAIVVLSMASSCAP